MRQDWFWSQAHWKLQLSGVLFGSVSEYLQSGGVQGEPRKVTQMCAAVPVCPHQWHQEQLTFSAEVSLWFWQTFFFLLVPGVLQKPWVYDLWEVWNGYPRQVRTSDTVPHYFSHQAPHVVPWVRSESSSYSLSTSIQSVVSFCAGIDSTLVLYLRFVSFC